MSGNGEQQRRIVVAGIDFSPVGELALVRTLELAADDPRVEPHFVHVAQASGPLLQIELANVTRTLTMDEASALLRSHVEHHVQALRDRRALEFDRAVTHVRVGTAADGIAELALDLDAELIVVGTHGRRGIRRLILGSVAEAVIRRAHCAVFVVRPKHDPGVELVAQPVLPAS